MSLSGDTLLKDTNELLFAGTSKIEITPEQILRLAGFGDRLGDYEEVCEPIFVRCLSLQQNKVTILLFSGDLLWWGSELVTRIKQAIQQEYQIDQDAVFLTATHNHSGPPTGLHTLSAIETYNQDYVDFLFNRVMTAARLALQVPKLAVLTRWKGECHLNVNRRLPVEEGIIMAPNYQALVDSSLDILRVSDERGQVISYVHRYACHATVSEQNKLHPEFPGIANRLLDEESPGTISFFLQGATGDLRPNLVLGDRFIKLGYHEACAFAKRYVEVIHNALASEGENVEPHLAVKREEVKLPIKNCRSDEQLRAVVKNYPFNSLEALWASRVLDNGNPQFQECNMGLLQIAHNFKIITFNAELVQYYSRFAKWIDQSCLVVCYTDGMIGYLCSRQEFLEGGYEPDQSHQWFALGGPYAPEIETMLENCIKRFLDSQAVS